MYFRILLVFVSISFSRALAEEKEPSQREIGLASMGALAQPLSLIAEGGHHSFLQSNLAKEELNLTDDQLSKILELTNSATPQSLAESVGMSIEEIGRDRIKGGDVDDKLMAAAKRIQKKMKLQSDSLLTDKQKSRLRQIEVQKYLMSGRTSPSLDQDLTFKFNEQIRKGKVELDREIRLMKMRFYWNTFTKVFDDSKLELRGPPVGAFKDAVGEKVKKNPSRRR